MDGGSDRHGFRGLVTNQRHFHSLLRRTTTSTEAAILDHGFDHGQIASLAPVSKSWKTRQGRPRRQCESCSSSPTPSSAINENGPQSLLDQHGHDDGSPIRFTAKLA